MEVPAHPWPEHARPLETEEAIAALESGEHVHALMFGQSIVTDEVIISLLRVGDAVAALEDGELVFMASAKAMIGEGYRMTEQGWRK